MLRFSITHYEMKSEWYFNTPHGPTTWMHAPVSSQLITKSNTIPVASCPRAANIMGEWFCPSVSCMVMLSRHGAPGFNSALSLLCLEYSVNTVHSHMCTHTAVNVFRFFSLLYWARIYAYFGSGSQEIAAQTLESIHLNQLAVKHWELFSGRSVDCVVKWFVLFDSWLVFSNQTEGWRFRTSDPKVHVHVYSLYTQLKLTQRGIIFQGKSTHRVHVVQMAHTK